jgi:hypothetical protein
VLVPEIKTPPGAGGSRSDEEYGARNAVSIAPHARLFQRSSTRATTLMFVFCKEKWQNRIVPVENGRSSVADACRVFAELVG